MPNPSGIRSILRVFFAVVLFLPAAQARLAARPVRQRPAPDARVSAGRLRAAGGSPAVPARSPLGASAEVGPAQEDKKGERREEKKEERKLPLKPERKVEFTTDEGTWISLDVSPDGRTIVFELLGDLYTLPIEGGEAKLLAVSDPAAKDGSGMAFDSQPRYSPDGKWIAFLSDRDGAENVWIAKADGTEPRKLSKDTNSEFASPTWTPDSEYVVVSRSAWALRTYELWMYHVQGGAGVQITKAKSDPKTPPAQRHNALGPVVSPDGRYIYYARKLGGFAYNITNFPLWQIARRDRITGDEDILTQAYGSAMRPALSPDGRKLVFGTRYENQTGLRIRDLTTGEERWLKYPVQRDDQESRFTRDLLPGYAFTPDGSAVIACFGGKLHRLDVAAGEDKVIPFTARVSQELGPRLYFPLRVEEGRVRARIIQSPVASPDGKRLAFSALTRLYVAELPKGPCPARPEPGQGERCRVTPHRLTSADAREFQPAWSPDGQWIAYVTWSEQGGQIWKVRSDGQARLPARSPAIPARPPLGASAEAGPGGQDAPQQLTRTAAFYSDPVWSPEGTRIVALRAPWRERLESQFDLAEPAGADLVWIPAEGGEAHLIIPARGMGQPHFTHEKDRIYVYSEAGLISLRYDGTDRRVHAKVTGPGLYFAEEPVPADEVRASPDGRWILAHVSNQLYLAALPLVGGEPPTINISAPAVPLKRITEVGADYFAWADDGATLTWAVGSTFFRQPFRAISFAPEKKEEKKEGQKEEQAGASMPAGTKASEAAPRSGEEKKPSSVEEIEVVVEQPRHTPKGTLVLRGAKVITMRGDEVMENADVVVTDNRIAGVGRRGSVSVPAGAKIFDVHGATIVPGFIDLHPHWFEIRRGILDLQNWSFLANLAYGVTAGVDVQTATNDMFAYQDLVDTGEILGLRAYSTGPGIFSNNNFQSLEETKRVVEKYKNYYRTRYLKSYIVGNRKQRQWMVQASKELEMMPTTEGGLDLKLDLTHTLDGFKGNEHALPIVPLYKDVTELVSKSGIFYTPTLIVAYGGPFGENWFYTTTEVHDDPKLARFIPKLILSSKTRRRPGWFRKDEYDFPQIAESAGRIIRSGGRVGIGSHGQLQGLGYHWEMWMLASGGLTPMEVLRAATLHGAEALGLAQDLGSIEPGKLADLVVLAKDPLRDIHNTTTVRYVMKNGELFEGDTLNQLLAAAEAAAAALVVERKAVAPGRMGFGTTAPTTAGRSRRAGLKRLVRGRSLVGEMPRSARHDSSVAGLRYAAPVFGVIPTPTCRGRNLTPDRAPRLMRFGERHPGDRETLWAPRPRALLAYRGRPPGR